MWVEYDIGHLRLREPHAATIGAFDGVHRGHQTLIGSMVAESRIRGVTPLVVTFHPLPGQLKDPQGYRLLSTLPERLERFAELGVEGAIVIQFDAAFMRTSALEFAAALASNLSLRALWTGPDFRLGRGREGDIAFLRQAGGRLGFDVRTLQHSVTWRGAPVRSSRIREALKIGDVETANGCLGHPYRLTGIVEHGERRGRLLGFPTANLQVEESRLRPGNGVYVCRAHLGTAAYHTITNVGTRPTFDHHPPNVEAHLLDFSGRIYGRTVQLDFLKYLRPELKFGSVDELVHQIRLDEATARAWLRDYRDEPEGRA